MAKRLSLFFFLAALTTLSLSAWPMATCALGWPGSLPSAAQLTNPALRDLGSAALCAAVWPPYAQTIPFHLAWVCASLSVIFLAVGRMKPTPATPPPVPPQRPRPQITPNMPPHVPLAPVKAIAISESMEFALGLGEHAEEEGIGLEGTSDLMSQIAFQEEEKRLMARKTHTLPGLHQGIGEFYSPLHLKESQTLYVDPSHSQASDTLVPGRGERPSLAFRTLGSALEEAASRTKVDASLVVQVRLTPGIYEGAVTLPSRVVLVHHMLPADGDKDSRRTWVRDLPPKDRVVLKAPESCPTVVTCEPGNQQGLFGLHIQGGPGQEGMAVGRSDSMRLWWCVFTACGQGALNIKNSGRTYGALGTADLHLLACIFHTNKARQGAAIFAHMSAMRLESCRFEGNHATQGGACFLSQMQGSVGFEGCEFQANKAVVSQVPEPHVQQIPPAAWAGFQGMGGGVYVADSQVKFHNCLFYKNGASVAGGALALVGSRAIVSGSGQGDPMRFRSNRARVASALMLVPGDGPEAATCRMIQALFEKNVSQRCGALMGVGEVTLEVSHTRFERNVADDIDGFGAACTLFYGAKMLAKGCLFSGNKAGTAGALYALCASAKLQEDTRFEHNSATFGRAGALEFLSWQPPFDAPRVPLTLDMSHTRFVDNTAQRAPAAFGIGGGGEGGGEGELTLTLGDQVTVRSNRVEGQPEQAAGAGTQAHIQWKGKAVVAERAVYRPQTFRL